MNLDSLPAIVTLLIALSVATERGVEIVKGLTPWLDTANPVPRKEGWRRAVLQLLAVGFGIAIAALTWPIIAQVLSRPQDDAKTLHEPTVLAFGLLAS